MHAYLWLYVLCGATAGIMSGLLFVRNDRLFIKSVSGLTPLAMPFVGFWLVDGFSPENTPKALTLSASYTAAAWFIFFLLFGLTAYLSGRKHNISFLQLVAGEHKDIISSAKHLQDKFSEMENAKESLRKKKELFREESKRLLQAKSDIDSRYEMYRKDLKEFKEEKDTVQRLFIISEGSEHISQEHVRECSKNISRLCKAISVVCDTTNRHGLALRKELQGQDNPADKIIVISENTKAYLTAVSIDINTYLMAGEGSRVHFRFQDSELLYRCIVAVHGRNGQPWLEKMKSIPYSGSLIQKSHLNYGQPIIASLNPQHAIFSTGGPWQDFLTIAPPLPSYRQLPLFSFGISVEDRRANINLFRHLCHVRFDQLLKDAMEPFFNIIMKSGLVAHRDFVKIAQKVFIQ